MSTVSKRVDDLEQRFYERRPGRRVISAEEAQELRAGTKTPWDFGVNPNMILQPGEPLFLVVSKP